MTADSIGFTLVTTVFNEIKRLDLSIQEIEGQSLLPSQIIIVDAGSKDGTYEKLLQWKGESKIAIDVLQDVGCNVAEGRNLAINRTSCDLIVSTDFGCRYHPDWLRSLVTPFAEDPRLEVAGGSFTIKKEDVMNLAQRTDYVLQNEYKVVMDDFFSPSSRSIAYKKYVWKKIGGYPESLTLAADDTIFWRQVKRHGFRYLFVDKPYVYWTRHQTFKGFAKEAGRYGLGDGESGINLRSYVSNGIETLLRYSLFLHILILPFYIRITFIPALILIPQLAGLRSYIRAIKQWWRINSPQFNLRILFGCFWMIEISRFSYLRSYTVGRMWRTQEQKELARKLRAEIS